LGSAIAAFLFAACAPTPFYLEVPLPKSQALGVVLDLNGADTAGYQLFLEPSADGTVSEPALNPARQGYRFGGWYTDSDCLTPFDFAATVITRTTVIYAKWEEIRWRLKFLLNDGTGGEYGEQSVLNGYHAIWMAPPSRSGYGFNGWYTDDACVTPFSFDQVITQAQDLHAGWDAQNRYVHYIGNYAGGAVTSTPYILGSTVNAGMLPAPVRTGYNFGGWYISPACTEPVWTGGVMDQDKTVYAKWSALTLSVTFDANGGSPASSSYDAAYGQRAVPPVTPPSKAGHNFAGWSETQDSLPAVDFTGDDAIITETKTFYALWTQLPTHTVTFNANGGSPTPSPYMAAYGQPAVPPVAPPSRAGYSFTGWYAAPTGGSPVDFTGDDAIITGNKTFYAQWTALTTYNVTFDANGGTPASASYMEAYGQRAVPPVTPPSKAEFTFTGWSAAPTGGSSVDFTGPAAIITGNKTFDAQWTALTTHTVTFNLNGGTLTGLSTPVSVIAGQRAIAPTGVPTKTGFTFKGWYDAAMSDNPWNFDTPISANRSIYAQWTSNAVDPANYVAVNFDSGPTVPYGGATPFKITVGAELIESKPYTTWYHRVTLYLPQGSTLARPTVQKTQDGASPSSFNKTFPLTITGATTITISW
jgi:uncharacterized repeat protein (TIGR02543 family)